MMMMMMMIYDFCVRPETVQGHSCIASSASENHTRTGHAFENSCCWMLVNAGMSSKTWRVTFDMCHRFTITVLVHTFHPFIHSSCRNTSLQCLWSRCTEILFLKKPSKTQLLSQMVSESLYRIYLQRISSFLTVVRLMLKDGGEGCVMWPSFLLEEHCCRFGEEQWFVFPVKYVCWMLQSRGICQIHPPMVCKDWSSVKLLESKC